MKTEVILRGPFAHRRSRLARACEARLRQTLARLATRVSRAELRLESRSAHDPSCRATLAVRPLHGSAFLVTADAARPWQAVSQVALAARRQLSEVRRRNRSRTRRAQRHWSEQRWAA